MSSREGGGGHQGRRGTGAVEGAPREPLRHPRPHTDDVDENPRSSESLLKTVDDTMGDIGELGRKALGPGGAVTQTLSDVGETAGGLSNPEVRRARRRQLGRRSRTSAGVGRRGRSGCRRARAGVGQLGQGVGSGVGEAGKDLGATGQAVGNLGAGTGQALGEASGQANPTGGDPANAGPGFGGAAKTILALAKSAASELVPGLNGSRERGCRRRPRRSAIGRRGHSDVSAADAEQTSRTVAGAHQAPPATARPPARSWGSRKLRCGEC